MLHLFQIFLILVYNRNRTAPANVTVFCDTYTGLGYGGMGKGFLIFAVHGKIVQFQKISIITREGNGISWRWVGGFCNFQRLCELARDKIPFVVRNGTTQCEMEVLDCETGALILRLIRKGGGTVGFIPFIILFRIA